MVISPYTDNSSGETNRKIKGTNEGIVGDIVSGLRE
jgi:hypothetical protein